MKRFLFIGMMIACVTDVLACAVPGTHNYYLFSTIETKEWSSSVEQQCMDNWRAYADNQDLHWFDADELKKIAQKKGDALMVSYIANLCKYLDVAEKTRETWEYPTKQELARRHQVLLGVQKYAFSQTKSRLRSQHALLYMRCNMMLDQHQTNVKFWEQTAVKFINSVYRDMMRNIYAGALLKTGRTGEATQIFLEQGDVESLYTYYYKKRSFDAIRAEYQKDANSPALPFLLQDFANNAQEAIDAVQDDLNMPGKLFIRDIKQKEALQMCSFAHQVVSEGKTKNAALWKSLEAWLQFLFDSKEKARKSISEAVTLQGSKRVKDNARVLRLFIEASQMKIGGRFDDFLSEELAWLDEKAHEERGSDHFFTNHYTQVFDRLVHQVLMPRYDEAGRHEQALAFLSAYDEQPRTLLLSLKESVANNQESTWNNDYSTEFFVHIDTLPIKELEKYVEYTCKEPSTKLDRWLSTQIRHDRQFFAELLGTKHLRLAQWKEAEEELSKVTLDFVNGMNIAPFMAQRDFRVEPWMKRQRIKEELQWPGSVKTRHHQKLEFAREMQKLEQGFSVMQPGVKAKRAYELAVRYAQASYAGDAWYLTRYGKSVADTLRSDEADMLQKAHQLLAVAMSTVTDFDWQEKVLFAQAYLPIGAWYVEQWSDKEADFVKVLCKESQQYKSLLALSQFEREHPGRAAAYVSRCDVLKQFTKLQK